MSTDVTSSKLDPPATTAVEAADQTRKPSWAGRLWDTFDLPPAERWLLFKVDASLLVFASLGYFIKNLDQTNVNSAFLSGMKEDLDMEGNQLVTSVSIWTAGYVIGQLPIMLLLTRVSPRWIIPSLELLWGIATLATYNVKSFKALYALRFFVGLFESGFYPAIHFLLSSWYTPRELAKRTAIFYCSGSLGQMFSGILQAAASRNLHNVGGLAGWRWLFIVDAIITIPIAILGFVLLPGLPWTASKPFWLSLEEVELAQKRMQLAGRAASRPWTKARVIGLFRSWHLYVLPIAYMLYNNAIAQVITGYWLKSFNPTATHAAPVPGTTFSISDINQYPLGGTAVFVVLTLGYSWTSDALGGLRWPFILFGSVLNIAVNAALVSTPLYTHFTRRFALYTLTPAAGSIGALLLNWAAEITGADSERRAVVIGASNDLAYLVQAIAPNYIWRTTDFPKATRGHIWSITLSSALIPWVGLIWSLQRRDARRRAAASRIEDAEDHGRASSTGTIAELATSDDDDDKHTSNREKSAFST